MSNKRQLTSYIDAMRNAADVITAENPDFVVAPMLGSVPFIDAMTIVSNEFDPSNVVYMPASSRIEDVNNVIRGWYSNFLDSKVDSPDIFPIVLGIDEVVSGASVTRCMKEIDKAIDSKKKRIRQSIIERVHSSNMGDCLLAASEADMLSDNEYAYDFSQIRENIKKKVYKTNNDLAKKDSQFIVDTVRNSMASKLAYRTVGIEDSKMEGNRNASYDSAKEAGRIIPVGVEMILTMDDPRYCPAKLQELEGSKDKRGYVKYSPKISGFEVTPEYVEFLQSLARHVGVNHLAVHPVNMSSILDSSKYLDGSQ